MFDRINKGQLIVIPIALINTSKEIWGETADQFEYVTTFVSKVVPLILVSLARQDGTPSLKQLATFLVSGEIC